jgi:hypothetical protein
VRTVLHPWLLRVIAVSLSVVVLGASGAAATSVERCVKRNGEYLICV